MRLIDGVTMYDGVVEICRNDVWGLITADSNFGQAEAQQLCAHLQLPSECENFAVIIKMATLYSMQKE